MTDGLARTPVRWRETAPSVVGASATPSPPSLAVPSRSAPAAAVERIWHTQDSQGQILALAFRQTSENRSSCPLFARKLEMGHSGAGGSATPSPPSLAVPPRPTLPRRNLERGVFTLLESRWSPARQRERWKVAGARRRSGEEDLNGRFLLPLAPFLSHPC